VGINPKRGIEEENMKFDLGEVLTRTWKIGWNHKVLWLWQMLPALVGIVFMPLFFIANPAFMMLMGMDSEPYWNSPWLPLGFMGLMFLLFIPSAFLSVMAQLAVTHGAVKAERGAEKLSFTELFRESLPYFWRVFGLYAIFFGTWIVLLFGFNIFVSLASMVTFGLASLCFMPMFLLFIPIMLVGFTVLEVAQAAIVADDMGLMGAISRSWTLFRANVLGLIILMLILYFGMTIISGFFAFPAMIPMMMFPIGFASQGEPNTVMVILFFAVFMLVFALMYLVQAILMAFFQTAWAVVYLRISQTDNSPVMADENS